MTPSVEAILGKARAFVEALSRLPRSARATVPHGHFARDYNTLRKLALKAAPGLDERLLGKYVEVYKAADVELSRASYAEIEVYARQIMEQLSLLHTSPSDGQTVALTPRNTATNTPKAYDVGVIRVGVIRQRHEQAYAPWSEEDDRHLRLQFLAGATIDELAREFGRQPGGIRSRLRKLGLDVVADPLEVAPHPEAGVTGFPQLHLGYWVIWAEQKTASVSC